MSPRYVIISILLSIFGHLSAQADTSAHRIYDRPFVLGFGPRASVGGYFEANSNYFVEEGITEGLSFEARRFNIFLFSAISHNIRFFSELEFEHGTEEIALETAILDLTFDPFLNFRMGVLLPPLGRFNVEHDSPKYNMIDRPLVSTRIIPATLSEVGAGFFGQRYLNRRNRIGYEIYLVNGLNDGIVSNDEAGTRIASGKSMEMLEEDNNGNPSVTGRIKFENRSFGEYGISYYGGIYNSYLAEGMEIDEKRLLRILALDYDLRYKRLHWRGEFASASIQVPDGLDELFGEKQWGFYSELNYDYFRGKLFSFDKAKMIAAIRFERIDLNMGTFDITDTNIGDETTRITVAHSFRLVENTVLKIVYQYNWYKDFTDNLIRSAGVQIGVAAYF